jgi:hypothetical protein
MLTPHTLSAAVPKPPFAAKRSVRR